MKQRKNYSTYELRTNGKESEWANVGWETERTSDWVSETEKSCQPVSQWIKVSVFQRVNESMSQWLSELVRACVIWVRGYVYQWLDAYELLCQWMSDWVRTKPLDWRGVSDLNEWMSERVSLIYEWMIECVFGWGSEDYHG